METVFEASLALEAHLVRDLLERAGIPSHIQGEYLQGAAGELPLGSLVRVCVAPEFAAEAREVVAEWEKAQPADSPRPVAERRRPWALLMLVVGGALGFLAGWIQYNTPVSNQGVDYDNDGTLDERYFYNGQKTDAVEMERNSDGHADIRFDYDSHGLVKEAQIDDNFDRRFETRQQMVRGQPSVETSDLDGDGIVELVSRYRNGVLSEVEFMSKSGAVLKRSSFRDGMLAAADFDADGDGTFERHVDYDEKGDPRP